ncbi:MAG TPA: metallophosphoesterase family protein [Acidimicrobiales bacterium]|nr:metallophosphoesterase family protein [Acidimicrobiales bacterium]
MTRVVVLSDTHIGAGGRRRLPDGAYRALNGADVILHGGDIVTADLLHELSGFAPTYAVLGNNDHDPELAHLPEDRMEVIGGVRLAMVHDSGPRAGREARMHRRFPDADVVVFGHSHIPWNQPGVDGQLLFNPGSPTERRSQPHRTVGVLDLGDGKVTQHRIVVV